VATAVGGTPRAVTDGVEGRLVPSGAPDSLAAALTEVVADPDLGPITDADLVQWCTTRLPDYGVPRRIRFLDEIPQKETLKSDV